MRRLADLLSASDEDDRIFAARFLNHTARGGQVTDSIWRAAQRTWEQAIQLQIDLGEPFPEAKAMVLLGILMSADRHLGG